MRGNKEATSSMHLVIVVLVCFVSLISAQYYAIEDTYAGSTFFNGFSFFTNGDPTHGYVTYVSASQATQDSLTSVSSSNVVYIYSDHTNIASGSGRNSVRIVSNKNYTGGLFLFDLAHMPFGCGTWPAVWTVGPNWPYNGEIDVIEGVNRNTVDSMTLHTSGNCSMSSSRASQMTGSAGQLNCDASVNGNTGCGVSDTRNSSYGAQYNQNGGGVHAMLWNSQSISVWFFPRASIPSDITSGAPNPAGWSTPAAYWPLGSNCEPSHFAQHQIVVDNTFCGDWAGNSYVFSGDGCGSESCSSFVQNNPGNFTESYWAINSFKVYQPSSIPPTNTPTTPTNTPTKQANSSALSSNAEQVIAHYYILLVVSVVAAFSVIF